MLVGLQLIQSSPRGLGVTTFSPPNPLFPFKGEGGLGFAALTGRHNMLRLKASGFHHLR
jgi:hypothetical protein